MTHKQYYYKILEIVNHDDVNSLAFGYSADNAGECADSDSDEFYEMFARTLDSYIDMGIDGEWPTLPTFQQLNNNN